MKNRTSILLIIWLSLGVFAHKNNTVKTISNVEDSTTSVKETTEQIQVNDTSTYENYFPRFRATAGFFIASSNSLIRIEDTHLGVGVDLNLADALGFDATNYLLRFHLSYSLGKKNPKRHALTAGYFSYIRSATKTLEKEFEFIDTVFTIGTVLKSHFSLNVIKFGYHYFFYENDKVRLGVDAGMYIMPINFTLGTEDTQSENYLDFIAPLPYIGFNAEFNITPHVRIAHTSDIMYAKINNFSGYIMDFSTLLTWDIFKHFGIGTGINFFQVNVDATGTSNLDREIYGDVNISYAGLLFYLTTTF